ncbi:hypothetical protein ACFW3Z_25580 [Nocardiopsis alba]|uniref:hypothetical protein n=1 Tax=Nocardiopsis alba TaxID=53437 RepID=UPI0036705AC3
MRDHLAVVECDHGGCEAQMAAPAARLTVRAETAGWQIAVPVSASADEDDVDLVLEDRCPEHQVQPLDLEEAARELRVPTRMLARHVAHARRTPRP